MKGNKKKKIKQKSLIYNIVTLTVFLDALFFVLVLSLALGLYFWNNTQSQFDMAQHQSQIVSDRFNEVIDDISLDMDKLSSNQKLIDYLNYVNAGNSAVITDTNDPNYSIYSDFINQINFVLDYQEDDLYNSVYVVTNNNCSTGTDGCLINQDSILSDDQWSLTNSVWYSQLQNDNFVLTPPYTDVSSEENVISYVRRVYDGNNVIGYVGVDILLTKFAAVLDDYYQDMSENVMVFYDIQNNPLLIYYTDNTLADYYLSDSSNYIQKDLELGYEDNGLSNIVNQYDSGNTIFLNAFNTKTNVTYIDLDDYNYTVVSIYNIETYISVEIMFLIILGFSLILILLIGFIMHRSVKKSFMPVKDILDAINEMKNGNFDKKIKVKENNEFRKIGNALNDMSEKIKAKMKKTYDALAYDSLTGLKNHASAVNELDQTVFQSKTRAAVCLIQVDNFKNINVSKGQIIGDNLIKAIADELKKVFRNNKTLFFNGGNEFIYIKEDIESLEEVEFALNRLLVHFRQPLVVKNIKTEIKLHIGVSIYPSDGNSLNELIKKCDTALFKTSEEGYKKIIFYNEKIARSVSYQAEISEQLAQAISKNQLYLKYQPLVTNDNEIYGFEALARWSSPILGEIGPQIFIANAEESYLIIPIGTWIFRQACLAQVEIRKKYNRNFVMSVNVSPVQILQKDFVSIVKKIVRETDVDPNYLTIEITESLFIEASVLLEDTIEQLHDIGIKLSLDDFGTGYASLTYLKQIDFDNLKIDKTFVDGIFANSTDHRIVATIVSLVHNLDMKVIAEGVETMKQYEYLKEIATDVFQGFIFSKPLKLEDVYIFMNRFYKIPKAKRAAVFASLNE